MKSASLECCLMDSLDCLLAVKSLCKKYKAASNGIDLTKGPFEELSQALRPEMLNLWTKEAEKAEQDRGEALDIYSLKMDKGWSVFPSMETLTLVQSLLQPLPWQQ